MIDFETKLDIRNALARLTPNDRAIARKVMDNELLTSGEWAKWTQTIRIELATSLDGVL
jgi:hypothetical protein